MTGARLPLALVLSQVNSTFQQSAPHRRESGAAYGIFSPGYGLVWFAGRVLMGTLPDRSIPALSVFPVVVPLISVPYLFLKGRGQEQLDIQ